MITRFYKNYIRSERWEAKRQQVFAHYGKRCYACRKYAKVIQVHHLSYNHLGNEPMVDLLPLCVPCHKEVTRRYRKGGRRHLRRVTMEFVKEQRSKSRQRKGMSL